MLMACQLLEAFVAAFVVAFVAAFVVAFVVASDPDAPFPRGDAS